MLFPTGVSARKTALTLENKAQSMTYDSALNVTLKSEVKTKIQGFKNQLVKL